VVHVRLLAIGKVIDALAPADARPFIAALPQAVLGNPDGPLAFMGHLDLAWSYSYEEPTASRSRPGRFVSLIKSLMARHRAGVAFRELTRHVNNINQEISNLIDEGTRTGTAPDAARLGHAWMLRQDLLGYVLLGDPAVQLSAMKRDGAA
jgi:hypothetical protein